MRIDLIFWISIITVGAHVAIMELIYTFHDAPENMYLKAKEWQTHLMKPLFYCPTCMASVWGTILYWAFGGDVYHYVPTIFAVAYLNTLLNKWVSN